ncbi:hypothetical protein M758_UG135000 [Ceratodon purpureus]|nr:hypothetical protein M758_UG135000 [Ceratodon purpureus]
MARTCKKSGLIVPLMALLRSMTYVQRPTVHINLSPKLMTSSDVGAPCPEVLVCGSSESQYTFLNHMNNFSNLGVHRPIRFKMIPLSPLSAVTLLFSDLTS